MPAAAADSFGVLDRMTAIFEAFDQDDRGLRISELAARAALPKSTVSRLVSTLVRQGYLERDGPVIHLGLRLFELGQLAEKYRELRAIALPAIADLRNGYGRDGVPGDPRRTRDGVHRDHAWSRGRAPHRSDRRTGTRPCHRSGEGDARVFGRSRHRCPDRPWPRGVDASDGPRTRAPPASALRRPAGSPRGGAGGVRPRRLQRRKPP